MKRRFIGQVYGVVNVVAPSTRVQMTCDLVPSFEGNKEKVYLQMSARVFMEVIQRFDGILHRGLRILQNIGRIR